MELTLIAARNRGCHRIYMNCLATNRAMQQLARKFTAEEVSCLAAHSHEPELTV